MRRKIAAGNWKMNLGPLAASVLTDALTKEFDGSGHVEMILAVPFVDLQIVGAILEGHPGMHLAAQNLHQADKGAYTGEISATMLVECGASYVLVGHSERRQYFHEGSDLLLAKLRQALAHGLRPIYCIGESLAERQAGNTLAVVGAQLDEVAFQLDAEAFGQLVIAYEPVWAIGTGQVATPEQAQEVHAAIRARIAGRYGAAAAQAMPILYGGSVSASSAATLFACPDIDGGLVGGASLVAQDFLAIARSFPG